MKLSTAFSLTLAILLSATGLQGQQNDAIDFREFYSPQSSAKSYDNFALELSRNPDLQKQKGWKYIARWIDQANRHTTGQGSPQSLLAFQQALESYTAEKNTKHTTQNAKRNNPWSPAGPFNAPEAVSDFIFTGTGRINTITFHPTDPNIMWIGGGQGGLWKTTNRAASWFPIGDQLPVLRVSDIQVNPDNPDEMYICLGDYAYLAYWLNTRDVKRNTHFGLGLYHSVDGGITWEPTGLTASQGEEDASLLRRSFIGSDDSDQLVAAGFKGVFVSDDRGDSWTQTLDGPIWDIERSPFDSNTLFASTGYIANLDFGNVGMWKSEDFGQTWIQLNIGIPAQFAAQRLEIAPSPADSTVVYVVACDMSGGLYGIYRSTDSGTTWELRANSPNILHWYQGGGSGGQATYDLCILADKHNAHRLYVGGINQWVSEDGGASWNGVSHWTGNFGPGVHADHHFLAQNPHDDQIYLCHDGGVSRTIEVIPGSWDSAFAQPGYNWPTTWENLNEGLANNAFYRLGVSQTSDNIFAGAQDMGTFLRDGGTWSYNSLGDGMECIISPLSDDILYGSTQYGNIFRSDDRGQSFGSINNPWQGESAEWTTPYTLHDVHPQRLYVPAANVYVSEDGGDFFEQYSDFDEYPISAFAATPSDISRLYVGKRVWYGNDQPGHIYVSNSPGNWKDISAGSPVDSLYITFLEVDDNDINRVWATFAGFADGVKVFESKDAGETWENISLNLPNLPANCIIHHDGADHDPLYVGMDRGIWYKNDTMDQWELYSDGLPNVIINDFDINYADGLLYSATFGRGIWVNNLLDNTASGTADLLPDTDLSILPNPSRGPATLRANDLPPGNYTIEMIGTNGQRVFSQKQWVGNGDLQMEIPHPGLSGLYYARIIGQAGLKTRAVMFE